jgi:hypothetical protein
MNNDPLMTRMAAMAILAAQHEDFAAPPVSTPPLRLSRGRGSQGSWAKTHQSCGELPEHAEWNRAVEERKQR